MCFKINYSIKLNPVYRIGERWDKQALIYIQSYSIPLLNNL